MKIARKMDEMEMSINLQAIRWSHLFTALALFAWGTVEFVRNMHAVPVGWIILGLQNVVWYYATQFLKHRSGDESARKYTLLSVVLTVVIVAVLLVLLWLFPN
jgi:hypothetical protein